jgi:predicted RNA-binding Zn-ribbon protein involved in translation (DUF1610 family)
MARARSLTEFQKEFPDEASCAAFLFERRWPDGFVCPVCGDGRAAALRSRAYTFECSDCGRQTSITAGTALHRTKLPLTVWFWAAHLMSTHSNGMSARQLEDQLGLTYRTAWLLTQKLRRSMVDPDRESPQGRRRAQARATASKNSDRNAPRRLGWRPNREPKSGFERGAAARYGRAWDNAISLSRSAGYLANNCV